MAQRSNADRSADKPNVSASKVKIFQRSRLYLQLITVFAIALAFCLGISIFFKVDTITVSGNNHYTPWTVAQASGIQEGENLLFSVVLKYAESSLQMPASSQMALISSQVETTPSKV